MEKGLLMKDNEEKEDLLQTLEKERGRYTTRVFALGIEIAIIFLIPALIALALIKFWNIENKLIPFVVSFLFSWIVFIFRWYEIHKKMVALDEKIKQARKEKNLGPNTSQIS